MNFRSEQDPNSINFMINLFKNISGKIYMEIGCAQLGTLEKFRRSVPFDGLVIGLDARRYKNWEEYSDYVLDSEFGCKNTMISSNGEHHEEFIESLTSELGEREIDFLFIDGNHMVEPTQLDYEDFSPFVREGGIIAFHDVDWSAFRRGDLLGQGAAVVLDKLRRQGYLINNVPGAIGLCYIIKK